MYIPPQFRDRTHAGQELARALDTYRGRADVLVLALPRGGVPVAHEVARWLGAALDVFVVRKLGVPWQQELAMGAIAHGGTRVLNREVIDGLGLTDEDIERAAAREEAELERREQLYRGDRPFPELRGRTVLVVDDGVATGSTMRAAAVAIRELGAARVVIAVPVAPLDAMEALRREADEVIALETPEPFIAIGLYYLDFAQTTDEEVSELLARTVAPEPHPTAPSER